MSPQLTRFLHVANGHSVTGTIKQAGIPGRRSIWGDPLHEGPVPDVGDDELVEIRRQYLSSGVDVDPAIDLRVWRRTIAALDYDELVLWYEYDLFDQLNLVHLLSWIRGSLPADVPVSLICIDAFPGHPNFKGLGELTPAELAPLIDTRQRVSADMYALAERAWHAFRQPSPEPIDRLRRGDTRAMPFLAAALERLLQDYPWTDDGLSRTERQLLRIVAADGPVVAFHAFLGLHEDADVYHVTDSALASLVGELSRTSPPLLSMDGDGSLRSTIAITEAGRDVLARRRDRVACGVDRWIGGVHLRLQNGNVGWRWNNDADRVELTTP
ncbi:MAG TPA: hypothetical protein VEU08_11280 [Vicinamibacterales bacterium]|nr:hypothetical protein [Vicinamibacterales bacterium]